MKLTNICCVLLAAGLSEAARIAAYHTVGENSNGDGIPTIQNNFNGWVNPEDLTPMPQCVAQQDQSSWLRTMSKCTSKRCTSHFGIICTHHQWLTELGCLSAEFSPDVVKEYLPYCSRSVLAKAQLYYWVRNTTGRTWLVDVGDANGLQTLSPASLAKGYAAVDVTYKAPVCLTGSISGTSMEPFQHVIGSCGFTSTTERTGNTARPWEYSESLRSMIALGFETVGYNLTGGSIGYGDYFDKECFCSVFTTPLSERPCSVLGQTDLTRERLWINATCGPRSLPDNWMDILKTIGFAYIPIEDWRWPRCVMDMPERVTELVHQCATDACEVDARGYCKIKRAIDRACICRDINYDSCDGLCHTFETRIDYVNWLHDLCSSVQDWHGLPDNWRQLASPLPREMIPWRWTLKPSKNSNNASIARLESMKAAGKCASDERKIASFVLVNMATFLAAFLIRRNRIRRIARDYIWHTSWLVRALLIAALELLANFFNAFLVQKTIGYEEVPMVQLVLLWCTMPRLGWLAIWLIGAQPSEAINVSVVASSLFAEVIHQGLSSYYISLTISHGLRHNFYFRSLENAERGQSAKTMYTGALVWLITISVVSFHIMRDINRRNRLTGSRRAAVSNLQVAYFPVDQSRFLGEASPMISERGDSLGYGTLAVESKSGQISRQAFANLYAVTVIGMLILWVAQWLFWSGFIGLSSEEFCPPNLGVLTAVWATSSIASVAIRAS